MYICIYLCIKLFDMPKKKMVHKIVAYDKEGNYYGSCSIENFTYNEVFNQYLEYCDFLTEGKFHNIGRIDLVGGNHVLFVFQDVRSLLNQHNLTIKLNNYD